MNPTTPPPGDDDLPDERELAALYARLPKTEPDPTLDAAVLAAATRATPVRRRPRWPVALGSAAVLVLAVGVGLHVGDVSIGPVDEHRTASAPVATGAITRDPMVPAAPAPSQPMPAPSAKPKAAATPPPAPPKARAPAHVT